MEDVVGKMLNHPIATVMIVGGITHGISSIIGAVKGNDVKPFISASIDATKEPKKKDA